MNINLSGKFKLNLSKKKHDKKHDKKHKKGKKKHN